jgi:hypothetical protein
MLSQNQNTKIELIIYILRSIQTGNIGVPHIFKTSCKYVDTGSHCSLL